MNYTDFSFWWLLGVIGGGLFVLRAAALRFGRWPDVGDRGVLACLSLVLFYNASPASFLIFLFEIGLNFLIVRALVTAKSGRAALVALALVFDFGVLAYFKYFEFLVGDFIAVISFGLVPSLPSGAGGGLEGIPPGISFYTFEMASIVVDTYRRPRPVRALDYLNFIAFFPHLVAGPIQRRDQLLPQLENFRICFTAANFDRGMRWFALGMFFKVVLADNVAQYIDLASVASPLQVLANVYLFGLRIYFDFAGYSFIGLGIAMMLGVELTVNFLAPYVSCNVREFWSRWHVTLSAWFRDYLYIPLGGGHVRFWALNVLIVFTISGLWHGAGWNYVVWGAYHGFLLILHRLWRQWGSVSRVVGSWQQRLPSGWFLTFPLVMFSWIFFMESDRQRLLRKLGILVDAEAWSQAWVPLFAGGNAVELAQLGVVLVLAHLILLAEHVASLRSRSLDGAVAYRLLTHRSVSFGMLICAFLLQARAKPPFIYFGF